jgi:hypothetical protein
LNPIYVITVVFNPRRFESRYRLYKQFAEWIQASGVKLLTVEVAFGERPFVLTDASEPWNLQLRTRHELWHKERALNLGLHHLAQLDPKWDYVAWMDADVRIARTDWHTEAVHLLQHYAIIQLFSESRILGPQHEGIFTCNSIGKTISIHGLTGWGGNPGVTTGEYLKQGHPGLGWAFRRDELNDIGGWLDTCVNGSGDLHMAACYAGDWSLVTSPKSSPGYRAAISKYGELCERYVRRNISFMRGSIDHYWHGRSSERGYQHRWTLIDKYQFDPYADLIPDIQGLWKWRMDDARVRSLAVDTRISLASRNEDVNEL